MLALDRPQPVEAERDSFRHQPHFLLHVKSLGSNKTSKASSRSAPGDSKNWALITKNITKESVPNHRRQKRARRVWTGQWELAARDPHMSRRRLLSNYFPQNFLIILSNSFSSSVAVCLFVCAHWCPGRHAEWLMPSPLARRSAAGLAQVGPLAVACPFSGRGCGPRPERPVAYSFSY